MRVKLQRVTHTYSRGNRHFTEIYFPVIFNETDVIENLSSVIVVADRTQAEEKYLSYYRHTAPVLSRRYVFGGWT